MKAVEKNTFYKATTLTVGSVALPNFGDLPYGGGGNLINLAGGYQGNYYTVSGNVATTPAYGESELMGGYLSVYVSGVTLANTPTLPQLELYRLKPGITISEGTVNLAYLSGNNSNVLDTDNNVLYPNGGSISVYHSLLDSDNYYMSEDFDGADKTLGDVKILKSAGTGVVELGDAYLSVSHAKNKGNAVGNRLGKHRTKCIKNYFMASDGTVPIEPEGDSISGVWRPQLDKRKTNKKKLVWQKPYWKWKKIKGVVNFHQKAPTSTDLEASPVSTPGNTIFDEVYATADTNNPFTSDVNNPLMMTSCELSTAKKYSGGQAFRMYHLWDYSDMSQYLQKSLGMEELAPTMTRASIYNIPHPPCPMSAPSAGIMPVGVPEISMRMNIAKLGFTPYVTCVGSDGGAVIPQGFADCVTYYPSGIAAESGGNVGGTTDYSNSTLTSLFRSVTVTWSNYKPKSDHTSLDKFLDYGLERFYTGETTENIVGGVTFFKTGIDGASDPSVIYATALPVTAWGGSGSSVVGGDLMVSGGLARGTITDTASDLQNTVMVLSDKWYGDPAKAVNGPSSVPLPMDSWFNMRVFYDRQQPNSKFSAAVDVMNPTGTTVNSTLYKQIGSPMRVFFETAMDLSGSVDSSGLDNLPYLDVYFPVGDTIATSGAVARSGLYTWENDPAYYPQHMTIWVQNYRYVSGANISGSSTAVEKFTRSNGTFYWGDNGYSGMDTGPLPNGAAIEAELYMDDIHFKNWTPDITNATAGASVSTQQPVTFRREGIQSPKTTAFYTFTGGGAASAWVDPATAGYTAGTGSIREYNSTECILFGFDDTGQLNMGTGSSNTPTDREMWGWLLCNGFNTSLYSNMTRCTPNALISSAGVGGNDNYGLYGDKLGGTFWNAGQWLGTYASLATDAEDPAGSQVLGSYYSVFANTLYTTGDAGDITTSTATTYPIYYPKGQINYLTYTNDGTGPSGIGPIPSQDGFTSKGLLRMYISGTEAGGTYGGRWQKREHIMASTKIIGVPDKPTKGVDNLSKYQIQVADSSIFSKYLNDEFIIYKMGMSAPSTTSYPTGTADTLGWGIDSNSNSLKLSSDVELDTKSNIITFNLDLTSADSGSAGLCNEANLGTLWISPKKYWITLYQGARKTARSYQNFCVVQNVGTDDSGNDDPTQAAMSGSTWNESVYGFDSTLTGSGGPPPTTRVGMSGLYTNTWNLEPSVNDSSLVTNIDFGYGVFDEEEDAGGEVSQATALIGKWVELDLSKMAADSSTVAGEDIVFRLGINDGGQEIVKVVSDEGTDVLQRPTVYWQYKDNLPRFSQPLKVQPNYNVLSGSGRDKVDLYKLDRENLNALKFTWEEEGDDVLYRLLYIDSGSVQNKYDGIHFQAPLDEVPSTTALSTGSYYTGATRIASATFNTGSKRTITGSSGWAFDGNFASSTSDTDWPQTAASIAWGWYGTTEATFIGHCVPNDTGSQTQGTIMTDMDGTYGSFKMYYTKAASANADVTPVFELVSGTAGYSGKTYTLTSDYSFPNDGESPLFVVVTFNATLPTNNLKMYVNGMLVKQSAGNWATDTAIYDGSSYSGQMNLGNEDDVAGTKKLRGTLQECMVHSKELYVPTMANEFILDNSYLPDMSSGSEIKYNARLFLFDYHNIIGSSDDRVCTSTEVTWEATGI